MATGPELAALPPLACRPALALVSRARQSETAPEERSIPFATALAVSGPSSFRCWRWARTRPSSSPGSSRRLLGPPFFFVLVTYRTLLSSEHRCSCDEPRKGVTVSTVHLASKPSSSVPRPGVFHHRRGTYISAPNLAPHTSKSEPKPTQSTPIDAHRPHLQALSA